MQARTTACLALILVLPASTRANDSSADDHGDTAQGSDWQLYNGNLDATRFSPLRQINHRNVGSLREIPDVELPETTAFVSGLLVIDHVLFVTTPGSTYAIDATTAKFLWSYDSHPKSLGLGTGNRSAAYANGRIYRGTPDDHLIALDAKTGRRLWDVQAFDPAKGEYIVAAPIVWQTNLYIGNAGSDVAAIGHVRASTSRTGASCGTSTMCPPAVLDRKPGHRIQAITEREVVSIAHLRSMQLQVNINLPPQLASAPSTSA
jgi:alcohol dehydrogenase (cytochrome c)